MEQSFNLKMLRTFSYQEDSSFVPTKHFYRLDGYTGHAHRAYCMNQDACTC